MIETGDNDGRIPTLSPVLNNKNMNNIYDKKFELYLIKKGFDLDTISLQECLTQIKIWKSNTENA